jgi:hypothetical protein
LRAAIVVLSVLAVLGLGFVYQRYTATQSRPQARLDGGAPTDGRERIDPHGPGTAVPDTPPLSLEARLRESAAGVWRIDIDLGALMAFDSVQVRAQRFDTEASVDAGWSNRVWSGSLTAGEHTKLNVDVPLGATPPVRVLVTARAQRGAGQRTSVTAIVRGEGVH